MRSLILYLTWVLIFLTGSCGKTSLVGTSGIQTLGSRDGLDANPPQIIPAKLTLKAFSPSNITSLADGKQIFQAKVGDIVWIEFGLSTESADDTGDHSI